MANEGDSHQEHTLGIMSAPNHTSEEQAAGWKSMTTLYYDVYNSSPRGKAKPEDHRTFASKISGALTDHAEDQKKLVRTEIQEWKVSDDLELRGAKALAADEVPLVELLPILSEEVTKAVERAGGPEAWAQLDPEELAARDLEVTKAVNQRVGTAVFEALPEEERRVARLFVHGGCTMHKDLNAAKGGYTAMAASWYDETGGYTGPILLMNRDNDAAAASGNSRAKARAIENSRGGGVKVTELAGALFRHKDDKKGQQDSFRYWCEKRIGRLITFPDTSNTRFGSVGDGATVLVTHLPLMLEYLEQIRDKKESGQWNHLEANVHSALQNTPTVTELAVLAIYSQTVSHPYMRAVRGPGRPNHLSLGPLHSRILAHLQRIIDDPDIVLGTGASDSSTTLDGQPWDNMEAFVIIREMIPDLPHLRRSLVAFFQGALETWKRFAAEFAPGGVVAQLSDVEKGLAFMAATNDANEGLLGSARVTLRHNPNMSIIHFNGRVTYARNNGRTYIRELSEEDRKFLRAQWREVDGFGFEKKRRRAIADAEERTAKAKRDARAAVRAKKTARLRELIDITPILNLAILNSRTTNAVLKEQLAWHRTFVDTGPKDEKLIPRVSDLPTKDTMLPALVAAVERYNTTLTLQETAMGELTKLRKVVEDAQHPQSTDMAVDGRGDWEAMDDELETYL